MALYICRQHRSCLSEVRYVFPLMPIVKKRIVVAGPSFLSQHHHSVAWEIEPPSIPTILFPFCVIDAKRRRRRRWSAHDEEEENVMCGFFSVFFLFLTTWPSIVTPAGLCNRSTTTTTRKRKTTHDPLPKPSGKSVQMNVVVWWLVGTTRLYCNQTPHPWVDAHARERVSLTKSTASNGRFPPWFISRVAVPVGCSTVCLSKQKWLAGVRRMNFHYKTNLNARSLAGKRWGWGI